MADNEFSSSSAEQLRELAQRALRLAEAILDREFSAKMRTLAAELLAQAQEIEMAGQAPRYTQEQPVVQQQQQQQRQPPKDHDPDDT